MGMTSLVVKLIIAVNVIALTIAQPTVMRCCHGSTIANNKIYVGGGLTGPGGNFTDDFFSLDLANPFSTSSDITYEVHAKVPIMSAEHTLVYAKNANNGMIYLFGGFRKPPEGSPIYGYVSEENTWKSITPKVRDGVIIPVNSTTRIVGITDINLSIIYIFDNGTMFIYDAWNNFWDSGELAPFSLKNYAAVMLTTSEIAYIGGSNGTANVPMSQILLYNTKSSLWYTKNAKATIDNKIPLPRQDHSASIAPDGRIFVYGGYDGNVTGSTPIFTVLEYVNGEFEWSSPELYNQPTAMRILHTSHVFENYLIIAFGQSLTESGLNTIELIDIRNRDNYTVVANFAPTTGNKKINSKILNIIAIVIGTMGFLLLIVFCFLFARALKRRK